MATKFLFVSYDGLIADIAWQVVKEGHEAKLWIQDPGECRRSPTASCRRANDWRKEIDWADVVVFDDVLGGMGAHGARSCAQAGKLVVGGSPYTDRLEDDRAFGQQELKAAGVPIIPQENFTSFDEAMTYVQANPNRYVIKPSGEAQNNKRLLFVGEEEDGRDVVQVLRGLQAPPVRHGEGVPAAAAHHRRRGRGGRVLQRPRVRHAGLRQLRAQEAVPRRHRPGHRRDGHLDVLERAEPPLQRHAEEDGVAARAGALLELHRRQLHRQLQRHLSARVHRALRLSRRSASSRKAC